MLVLKGHKAPVTDIAISSDGRTLASSAGNGRTVWVWDLTTGQCRTRLRGHLHRVVSLGFAPNTSLLASIDGVARVLLRDVTTGRTQWIIPPANRWSAGHGLAFSPDAKTLAWIHNCYYPISSSGVQLHNVADGNVRETLPHQNGWFNALAYSPDGSFLAVHSYGETRVREIAAKRWRPELKQTAGGACLTFSPNNKTLAVAAGWSIALWDVHTSDLRAVLKGHKHVVRSLAFHPDGRTLTSASADGTVRTWDVATGQVRQVFDWKIGRVRAVAIAPDGMRAVAGGTSGEIVIWDVDPA